MPKEKYEVTLNSNDILKITEMICKRDETIRKKVGPASLEYELFQAIRTLKGIDFFEEEDKLSS